MNEIDDHYPWQPSDWGDFNTAPGGCVIDGIYPPEHCPTQIQAFEVHGGCA